MRIIFLFVLLLLLTSIIPLTTGQINPIAVSGWVYLEDSSPTANAAVTVFNVNTVFYANVTTDVNGQYVTTMSGSDGDIIRVNCTHLDESGVNTVTVDLADVTQFCNLSLAATAVSPVALFTYTQYNLEGMLTPQGPTVFFHDYSTDADGSIVSWHWSFGDGHTSVGKSPHHTYDEDGSYRVTLTVTDNDGLTDDMSETVTVRTRAREGNVSIPKPMTPLYPGFTVPEMYDLLRVSNLPNSDSKITVVFLDSGLTSRKYEGINLASIESYHHSSYTNGIDVNGHGTFVSYELGYIMQTKTPNAILISYKIFGKGGECSPSMFIEALDEIKKLNPDIVSISAGMLGHPDDAFSKKIKEIRGSGIIVICAAGNLGPSPSTILSPACSGSALAIAASNPRWSDDKEERQRIILNLSDDTICFWSSRGPVPNVYPKPDCASPGESIIGPWLDGETIKSGTSMSTPLIAGGAAVVLANNKGLVDIVSFIYFWDPGVIANVFEDALKDGCYKKGNFNDWGTGIPVFTDVNSIFYWTLIILILIPIIIASVIIVFFIVIYWFYKKTRVDDTVKRKKKTTRTGYL